MRVRYTLEAQRELLEILLWLRARSPTAAAALADRISQAAARLEDMPFLGQVRHPPNVRGLPIGRYPYLMFYIVEENEVSILSIRHTSRRPPRAEDFR